MAPIIPDNMGDLRRSRNVRVAANQTIKKGDPIEITTGLASKGVIGSTAIDGFAAHDITTGATTVDTERLIVDIARAGDEFKGTLKAAQATATDQALADTTAGFIVEAGEYRIDPAAAVKNIKITRVIEPYTHRKVKFIVEDADRDLK